MGDSGSKIASLNILDLAGSEGIKQTGTLGDLFKEAVEINLDRSALCCVVNKLVKKNNDNTYIAFQGSKLILLLENFS
jgi:ATP-dependent Lon protease